MLNMKFEDFNFEVIDVSASRSGNPDMHVTQNGITFTHKLIEDMGYPQYVRPMIDIKRKVFALRACKADAENALRFSKQKTEQKKALVSYSGAVRRIIYGIMGGEWKRENRYYITGVWYSDAKAMVFDLNTARELPPYIAPAHR